MIEVELGNRAKKQFFELEPKMRRRVEELIEFLKNEPVPFREYDLRKLKGEEEGFRVRLSRFRVTYYFFKRQGTIQIAKIEPRTDSTYD